MSAKTRFNASVSARPCVVVGLATTVDEELRLGRGHATNNATMGISIIRFMFGQVVLCNSCLINSFANAIKVAESQVCGCGPRTNKAQRYLQCSTIPSFWSVDGSTRFTGWAAPRPPWANGACRAGGWDAAGEALALAVLIAPLTRGAQSSTVPVPKISFAPWDRPLCTTSAR